MSRSRKSTGKGRSTARLAAVQALYQMDMEKIGLARLLHEFHAHRLGGEVGDEENEDARYANAEVDFFDAVVSGVDNGREAIDGLIEAKLAEDWALARLDKTMLQILRAGAWELMYRKDVPRKVAINEYVDVAKAFFDDREAKFVNGLLDAIAGEVRG